MAKTDEAHTSKTNKCKTGTNEQGANGTSSNETTKEAPIKLELFDGDTIGFCDAETGVCAVPAPVGAASAPDGQRQPTADEHARALAGFGDAFVA